MLDKAYKPRRVEVTDELFEELKAKDEDVRDSKKNAVVGTKQNKKEDDDEDYLSKLLREFNMS